MELFHYILKKHGHVSSERVLSGPGIKTIYDFLRDTKKAEEPAWLKEEMGKTHDVPALISKAAHEGKAPICDQTMSLFVCSIRCQGRRLCVEFDVHGWRFHLRHHRGQKSFEDERADLYRVIPKQGTFARTAGRYAGQDRAE